MDTSTMKGDCSVPSFKAAELDIKLSTDPVTHHDVFTFGTVFTNHMLTIEWDASEGWQRPMIRPFENLPLHPACSSLHYGIQLFEGLKAYCGDDNQLRLFRPMLNMERMVKSAKRACLPIFEPSELLECIRKLVEIDQDCIPRSDTASLYIRPTLISTEPILGVRKPGQALLFVIMSLARSVNQATPKGLSLWADAKYTRAWQGGTGDCKIGGNYGGGLVAQCEAEDNGCQQVLWLYGEDHQITEAGTSNIFVHWINEDGEEELATPPLNGIILAGVTRRSILELTRQWGEFKVTERYLNMAQLCGALKQGRVKQVFGSGTACMIWSLGEILYMGEHLHIPCQDKRTQLSARILKQLTDIQFGRTPSDWTFLV